MNDKQFVSYEDFGAVGDGVTDDLSAIAKAHQYANENSLPVKSKDGAHYYIGSGDTTVVIRTDTDWTGSRFTIDDSCPVNSKAHIFSVSSDSESYPIIITELKKNQKKLDFPHEGKVFVKVVSEGQRVYIRKGLNANNGSQPMDSFVVDAQGNILHGINWDHTDIVSATARSVDDTPITIRGGEFTTLANNSKEDIGYVNRCFNIHRANVTFDGIKHFVKGEEEIGSAYAGFFCVSSTYNVTIKNCVLSPHKTYRHFISKGDPTKTVARGTYDINANCALSLKLINVTQTGDLMDSRYWGIMGTNFCKDFLLDGCVLSRFDAHCGVTDGVIRNSTLAEFTLIGFGDFLIENTTFLENRVLKFRADYGSFFKGSLTMRDVKLTISRDLLTVFTASNTADHYFGYDCELPHTIVMENVLIDDTGKSGNAPLYLFGSYDPDFSEGKPYPLVTPKKLITNNVRTVSGREIKVTEFPVMYPHIGNQTVE